MEANKNVSPIVTELFLGGRKLNISLVITITMLHNHNHIPQSSFKVPKTIRLNTTHCFIENFNKQHLSKNEFKDFMKLYKDYTKKP